MTQAETEKEMEAVRYMVHCRLNEVGRFGPQAISAASHLDEDAICAFLEGRPDERETVSVITHLTSCGSCRQLTARLIRLESTFTAEAESSISEESPSRLHQFLKDLASTVIPSTSEDAVFAYQNPEADKTVEPPAETPPTKPNDKEKE